MKEYTIAALSFLGDAVYELEIRNYLLSLGIKDGDKLHRECTRFVRAEAQAKVVKVFLAESAEPLSSSGCLSPEEVALVKRARNHKFANRSRSADPVEYRLATGMEALMGRLYLDGQQERIKELTEKAILIVGGKHE